MPRQRFGFWFYVFILFLAVIAFAYYQGLTADVQAVGPFIIQAGELAQGRNPNSGDFSPYPTNGPTKQ